MPRRVRKGPGKDEWSNALKYLKDEVDRQQRRVILRRPRLLDLVESDSPGKGEQGDDEEDGGFSFTNLDEVGGGDIGDYCDAAWDHVVEDGLEGCEAEAFQDEGSERPNPTGDEGDTEYSGGVSRGLS